MAGATQTPEQWTQTVQAIIAWLDPHVSRDDDDTLAGDGSPDSAIRRDPVPVRNAIELMRSVAQGANESYANPLVHAHYLYHTPQFTRMKISCFLAQEYESPYMEGHPILPYYLHLNTLEGKSIIESLRMYFKEFKLEAPSNTNELYNLMYAFSTKYCNDNIEARNKYDNNNNNTLNTNNEPTLIDDNNIFLGDVAELTKIYQQCIASETGLHGKVAVGRIRPTELKFVETLTGELRDDSIKQFNETQMRQIFESIKRSSLRDIKTEKDDGNESDSGEIVYSRDNTNRSHIDPSDPNPPKIDGCCVIL